jgi:hypothetical protein
MLMRRPKPKLDDLVLDLRGFKPKRKMWTYTSRCFYFSKRVSRPDPVQDPPPEPKPKKQPKPKREARPARARAEPKPARTKTRTEYEPSPEEIEAAKLQMRDRKRSEMLKPDYR